MSKACMKNGRAVADWRQYATEMPLLYAHFLHVRRHEYMVFSFVEVHVARLTGAYPWNDGFATLIKVRVLFRANVALPANAKSCVHGTTMNLSLSSLEKILILANSAARCGPRDSVL